MSHSCSVTITCGLMLLLALTVIASSCSFIDAIRRAWGVLTAWVYCLSTSNEILQEMARGSGISLCILLIHLHRTAMPSLRADDSQPGLIRLSMARISYHSSIVFQLLEVSAPYCHPNSLASSNSNPPSSSCKDMKLDSQLLETCRNVIMPFAYIFH